MLDQLHSIPTTDVVTFTNFQFAVLLKLPCQLKFRMPANQCLPSSDKSVNRKNLLPSCFPRKRIRDPDAFLLDENRGLSEKGIVKGIK